MEQPTLQPTEAPDTSFTTVLANVFASPGEAFAGLTGGPVKHTRWVVPFLITVLLVVAVVVLMFTNDAFREQMQNAQMVQMDKAVEDGRMTRDQADMAMERMEGGGGTMFIVFGGIFGSVFVLLFYVLGALFLWLGAKLVLKSPESFGRHLEVYGIASWIGVVGGVITIVMMLAMSSMYATPSAALAIYDAFDPGNTTHRLMRALDIFGAWQAVVAGIGISRVAGKDSTMGIIVAVGLWLVWVGISVALGLAR
ncbi:MAG: YIP1 family protein [Bacteroidetes bacterium]|jgi:hypothetical protein|nr:YIP1 family protein [Bacteroidota bacterium]